MWSGASNSIDNDRFEKNKRQKTNNVDYASPLHWDCAASVSASATSSSQPLEYEVFLNFRGPDTRYQITDILYRFLMNLKIRTFKDDDELRRGEGIWPNLAKAIEQSKIYVPIFSQNYAYSRWCLKELVAIVEHQEKNQACIILPIFYMVDPRDVRHQSGPYRNAFEEHKNNFDQTTIRVWRDALNKVGALKGWHTESVNEQGAIADLVTGIILSHLSKNNNLLEIDKLIGIDANIKAVEERMNLDSEGVSIVGIHGIGGIGKTTIAKAVFSKLSAQFDRCSFVENVQEMLHQKDGVLTLQKHLISDILRNVNGSIASTSEGIKIVRERISRFKCLIVLDDVDENFEFEEMLGNIDNFVSGNRFMMTSRNVKVLRSLTEECKLYRVLEMSHQHSLQLFCKHAFKMNCPPSSYEILSKDIVSVAAGLPLTLKVVGSLLFKEEEMIWKDKLRQLKEIPEEKVVDKLKISYDTLNEDAKRIFLDIACFFFGESKEIASYFWSDCGFFPTTNLNILIQRSMIEIVFNDSHNTHMFRMHDQLRDMGREIVRRENIKGPWKRSRIWSKDKALEMLRNNKGTNGVEGIRMHYNDFDHEEKLGKIRKECFMKLSELRYLDIEAVKMLVDDFSDYVPNLRWLRLSIGVLSIPHFSMENLVILELFTYLGNESGALKHIKKASKLKVLKLSCGYLDEFPEFPRSGSLEILDLETSFHHFPWWCIRKDLDIGNLRNLKVLRLKNCWVRKITDGTAGMMPFKKLKVLHLEGCWIREITGVTAGTMSVEDIKVQQHLLPSSLTTLIIIDCPKLEWLPNLENLESLTYLSIAGCPLLEEIPGLGGMKSLEALSISDLIALRNVDGLDSLYSLKSLSLRGCDALSRLPSMSSLSKLLDLVISSCLLLEEIQGLGGLELLQTLHIHRAVSLSRLFGFETVLSLNKLKGLKISDCPLLKLLPFHELDDGRRSQAAVVLDSLQELDIRGTGLVLHTFCQMIRLLMFPSLATLILTGVNIGNADTELHLDGLESMEELVDLRLYDLISLRRLPCLSKLRNLRKFTVANAPSLRGIEGLASLTSLEELYIIGCTSLGKLPADQLHGLKRLRFITQT